VARIGFRRHITIAALVASMLLTAGDAQPHVQVAALVVDPGTLQGFLLSHSVVRTQPRTPGTHLQSGSGLCFGPTSAQRSTTFACFYRALRDSGPDVILDGSRTYTVFAPTDSAFAHLAATIGSARFRRLMGRHDAVVALIQQLIVPGSHALGSLAFGAPAGGRTLVLSTLSGPALRIEIGPGSGDLSSARYVAVGPASAADGQAFANGVSRRFRDGSVLIPIDRVPIAVWLAEPIP